MACCLMAPSPYLNQRWLTHLYDPVAFISGQFDKKTRYVDGTPTSEVTPVTIRYIRPSHHGHTRSWMDDSHPFRSMSISHPIPNTKLFQTLTLKLQGQGHGCGQRARSYNRPSIILTHFFSFHINQTNNSWDGAISKFDLETSKVKVMSEVKGQGHTLCPVSNQCTSFSFHINRTNHSWDMAKTVFHLEKTHPKFLKKICQNFPTELLQILIG